MTRKTSIHPHEEYSLAKRYSLPPDRRLRHQRDFDRVFADSQHAADKVLVVLARRNELAWSRIGVVVSRKVGTAVVRNYWKRLVREAFRLQQHALPAGLDLVVRPRRGGEPEFHALCRSLLTLARRLDRTLTSANAQPKTSDELDQNSQ
jgi:ribonuclease P protein component